MIPDTLIRWALYAALVGAVLFGIHTYLERRDEASFQRGADSVQQRWSAERTAQLADQVERGRRAFIETERRMAKQQENQDAQDHELAVERAARARADAVAGGLREQFANSSRSLVACAAGGDSAAVGNGAPARAAADLQADVFGRIDQAASVLARYAGEAAAAGRKCERDYDANRGAVP